jgi:hypothetical protein
MKFTVAYENCIAICYYKVYKCEINNEINHLFII